MTLVFDDALDRPLHPQQRAADPRLNAFVTANAGAGKTTTLVDRVARLLLREADPGAILCVTYTKAAAAEMQTRLFQKLGEWAVAGDDDLTKALNDIGAPEAERADARRLFARALETPGGLKIQTLHAFCEQLLRRFPLEAGVTPGFTVMEEAEARLVAERARESVALHVLKAPEGEIAQAYAHLAVELDGRSFDAVLAAIDGKREQLAAYREACAARGWSMAADVWRVCGFPGGEPLHPEAVEREAIEACEWAQWRRHAAELALSTATDQKLSGEMLRIADCAASGEASFADCWKRFSKADGEPLARVGSVKLADATRDWLAQEQQRLHAACQKANAARQAMDTSCVLTLGEAFSAAYAHQKQVRNALDFADLTERAKALLTDADQSAWVLYKLDGGIDHVLVDEAQDTSPSQWAVVRAIATEFFSGHGAPRQRWKKPTSLARTVFAVGDKKQSIYSFQGAEPERLTRESQAYDSVINRIEGRRFEGIDLVESYRSTPQVLRFVDSVFAEPEARSALGDTADVVRHVAQRTDHAGCVDLWPPFKDEPTDESDPWEAPLDQEPVMSARKRLARRIARWVKEIGERGEGVWDKQAKAWRSAQPGDVLILVRRRDALFEEVIRALKREGLPVAGADRLNLSRHIVFADVLALIRFALFPWDDLKVAALLRSPFCGVSEQGLYDLAQGRERTPLYTTLTRRSSEREDWADAARFLSWAREEGRGHGPFDFIAHVLSRLDAKGRSQRQRLVTRLGEEAADASEALLAEALAAEGKGVTDLERFAVALERTTVEVKREMEAASGQVRVMTVHGAKGLEAPIVILPDAATPPRPARGGLFTTEDGGFLYAPREKEDTPASAEARGLKRWKDEAESLRLLYVALTRARDRLVICGRLAAGKDVHEESWYARLEQAFDDPVLSGEVREVQDGDLSLRRYGPDPQWALAADAVQAEAPPLPQWAKDFAPDEPATAEFASPSAFAERRRGPAPSPLAAVGGLGRFRRGELIHRLLQRLPDLPVEDRAAAASEILDAEQDLTFEQRREMAQAALGVLNDPRFAPVFAPGGRAEAAVAGGAPDLPPGLLISGRVDRMVVGKDRVLVVDFKTNRPSPDRIEQADPAYLMQMAIYVAVLRAIFPQKTVEAALVWTDGPKLMPIPEATVAWQLAQLRRTTAPEKVTSAGH